MFHLKKKLPSKLSFVRHHIKSTMKLAVAWTTVGFDTASIQHIITRNCSVEQLKEVSKLIVDNNIIGNGTSYQFHSQKLFVNNDYIVLNWIRNSIKQNLKN